MKRRLKPKDAGNWTRNMGVSLEGRRSNWGHGGKLLSAHHMFSALKAGALHLSLALDHIFLSKYSLPLPYHQVVRHSFPTTFARWTSFVYHLIQGFSTGIAFALQGTHGDMWRQLWLSQLGLGVWMGLLASSELKQGPCHTSYKAEVALHDQVFSLLQHQWFRDWETLAFSVYF